MPASDFVPKLPTSLFLALLPIAVGIHYLSRKPRRKEKIAEQDERVLILGASSGIGRSIAHQYASRGARVCIVGRREDKVEGVVWECKAYSGSSDKARITGIPADFTDANDLVRIRQFIESEWDGLDTLVVAAGVSALQPLMAVAGADDRIKDATREGIQYTVDIAKKAINNNYYGPLAAAVAFIPILSRTSPSPSILLISSLAAVIPAPTRTLYASTKAASLVLYQALSIEHPDISFSAILPYTVEGDFRASAVDAGPVRESDPKKHGLKREVVAKRCIQAVDTGEKAVFLPAFYKAGMFLYWLCPAFVEWRARKKYNFTT